MTISALDYSLILEGLSFSEDNEFAALFNPVTAELNFSPKNTTLDLKQITQVANELVDSLGYSASARMLDDKIILTMIFNNVSALYKFIMDKNIKISEELAKDGYNKLLKLVRKVNETAREINSAKNILSDLLHLLQDQLIINSFTI